MNLGSKELITWMKQELELHYAYPSSIKLMTSNGFDILLILVERIKRDIAQTSEGIDGTTGRIWKQRMNSNDNQEREILNEPP